uniref:Major facilitator superfamily (MFS) profile domain-containing protein n=2 Tax=Clastoptera arizonana TaxID=38151 RepID=A0A1B6DBS9_9HEMI
MSANHDSDKKVINFPPKFRRNCNIAQYLVSIVLGGINANMGLVLSLQVIVIGDLLSGKESFHINSFEASWFGSLPFIFISTSSILAGFLQEKFGRKGTILFAHVPVIAGFVCLYLTDSVVLLYSSAISFGLFAGFNQGASMTYAGEVFQPELRGTLTSIPGIFFNIGFIVVFLLSTIYPWRKIVFICTVLPIVTFICTFILPESPLWLVQQKKNKKAKKALKWLRGWTTEEYIQDEWDALINQVNAKTRKNDSKLPECQNLARSDTGPEEELTVFQTCSLFFGSEVQRPMYLVLTYFLGVLCCCLMPFKPMLIEVMSEMKIKFDPHLFLFISALLQFAGACSFSIVLRRYGKRVLTIFGFTVSIATCYGLAAYIMLGIQKSWIPLVLLSINSFIATFGLITIPWILISEVFPLRFRGIASGVSAALSNGIMFLTIKTYVNFKTLLGLPGSIIMYGTIAVFSLLYLYLNLPETEGKTLEDIELGFQQKKANAQHQNPKVEEVQQN